MKSASRCWTAQP